MPDAPVRWEAHRQLHEIHALTTKQSFDRPAYYLDNNETQAYYKV